MEIKENNSKLENFAELIKAPNRTQNMCICSGILSKPANQSKILQSLANEAHRNSKLAAETGDDFYSAQAEEMRKIWKELRIAFGIEDENEEN